VTRPAADVVYLDYSATTPVDPRVVEAMLPFFTEHFGNPNSLYELGRQASDALEAARASFASSIGAVDPGEVVFTGSGTESDDAAVLGIAQASSGRGRHVVISAFEHHAVLEPARRLVSLGFEVSRVVPDASGIVRAEALAESIREDTVLVSVMHANNEIGTVQDVRELAAVARDSGAVFHSDAAQSLGKVPVDVDELGVDAMSFSSHKIYGPKGVGVLYLRAGTPFEPFVLGGGQERGRRSGTQNVAGAVGIARAAEIMEEERSSEMPRLRGLRDAFEEGLLLRVPEARIVTQTSERLPHVSCFLVPGCEAGEILLHLDEAGIAVASGSACSSGSGDPSHVLLEIGIPRDLAFGAVRVSFGRFSGDEDLAAILDVLPGVVEKVGRKNARSAPGTSRKGPSGPEGS
jgi:cysteine desulfurase